MRLDPISISQIRGHNVVIYGAGIYGKAVYKVLAYYHVTVSSFADRNSDILTSFMNIRVINPKDISKINDRIVLIASFNHIDEMILNLERIHVTEYYSILNIIKEMPNVTGMDEYELEISKNSIKYESKVEAINEDKLIVSNIDLVITEKCNLSCQGCGSLIPYYNNPQNISSQQIESTFDRFMDAIDELLELRLLGGETFLYPELSELIDYYSVNPKIKKIVLFTNSTVVPDTSVMHHLQNEKVEVHMSDYGSTSNKIDINKKKFDENHVNYYIHSYSDWRDMGDLKKRDYSDEMLQGIFRGCDNKNCPSFYRGKMYICPRAAHGERLGFFVNNNNETIDFNVEGKTLDDIRKEIRKLSKKEIFTACRFCSGNNIYSDPIHAAIQIDRRKLCRK